MARRGAKVLRPCTRRRNSGGADASPAGAPATAAAAFRTPDTEDHTIMKTAENSATERAGGRRITAETTPVRALGEAPPAAHAFLHCTSVPTTAAKGSAAEVAAVPDRKGSTAAAQAAERSAGRAANEVFFSAAAEKAAERAEELGSTDKSASATAAGKAEPLVCDDSKRQREGAEDVSGGTREKEGKRASASALETRGSGQDSGITAGMPTTTPTAAEARRPETRVERPERARIPSAETVTASAQAAETSSDNKNVERSCFGVHIDTRGHTEFLDGAPAAAAEVAAGARPTTAASATARTSESAASVAVICASTADTLAGDGTLRTADVVPAADSRNMASVAGSRTCVDRATIVAAESSERLRKCTGLKTAGETAADKAVTAVAAAAGAAAQNNVTAAVVLTAVTTVEAAQSQQAAVGTTGMHLTPAAFPGFATGTGTAGTQDNAAAVALAAPETGQRPRNAAAELLQTAAAQGEPEASTTLSEKEDAAPVEGNGATAMSGCQAGTIDSTGSVSTRSGHKAESTTTHSKGSDLQALRFGVAWNKKQDPLQGMDAAEPTKTTQTEIDWKTDKAAKEGDTERTKGSSTKEGTGDNKNSAGGAGATATRSSTANNLAVGSGIWGSSRESSSSSRGSRRSKHRYNTRRDSTKSVSSSISGSSNVTYCWSGKQAMNLRGQSSGCCGSSIELQGRRKRQAEGTADKQQSGKEIARLLHEQHQPKDRDSERARNSPHPREAMEGLRLSGGEQDTLQQLPQQQDKQQEQQQEATQGQHLQSPQKQPKGGGERKHGVHQQKQEMKEDVELPPERRENRRKEEQRLLSEVRNVIANHQQGIFEQNSEKGSNSLNNSPQMHPDQTTSAFSRGGEAEITEKTPATGSTGTAARSAAPTLAAAASSALELPVEETSATEMGTNAEVATVPMAAGTTAATTKSKILVVDKSPTGATAKGIEAAVAAAEGAATAGKAAGVAATEAFLTQAAAAGGRENTQGIGLGPRTVATIAAAAVEGKAASKTEMRVSPATAAAPAAKKAPFYVQNRDQDLAAEARNSMLSSSLTPALEKGRLGDGGAVDVAPRLLSASRKAAADATKAAVPAAAAEKDIISRVGRQEGAEKSVKTEASTATPAAGKELANLQQGIGGEAPDTAAALVVVSGGQHRNEVDQWVRDQQHQQKHNSLQGKEQRQTWLRHQEELNEDSEQDSGEHVGERRTQDVKCADHQEKANGQDRDTEQLRQKRETLYHQRVDQQPEEHQRNSEESKAEEQLKSRWDVQPQERQQSLGQEKQQSLDQEKQEQEKRQGGRQEYEQTREVSCQRCEKRFAEAINALPHLLRLLQLHTHQVRVGERQLHLDKEQHKPPTQQQSGKRGQQPGSQKEEQRLNRTQQHLPTKQQTCNQDANGRQQHVGWFSPDWREQNLSEAPQMQGHKRLRKYHQDNDEREKEENQRHQADTHPEWVDAEEKEREQKARESTKLGEGLSFDYLRAAVKEKVRELRRQQQQSCLNFEPLVEDAAALSKYLEHVRTQQSVMQRQISLLQKQLLHMDQQQATLEQQRCQLRSVQETIKWRQKQLLQPADVGVLHQQPLPPRRTDTAKQHQQQEERQTELAQQQQHVERTVVQHRSQPQAKQLLRGLLQHEHEVDEDEALVTQRQGRDVTLQEELGSALALKQLQQHSQALEGAPLLDERQRQLLLQLMQELSHRPTQPLQQHQQPREGACPVQPPQEDKHQVISKTPPGQHRQQQSDEEFRQSLQQHQQRHSQNYYARLLEQQENEDLAQAGVLPQHQQQHGDYSGSVSASLERILIKLTSSDSCLNADAPADSTFPPITPIRVAGSFPMCHMPEALRVGAGPSAFASFAGSHVAAASFPAAPPPISPASVSRAAAEAVVPPQRPSSTYLCSSDAAEKQGQRRQRGEQSRREPVKEKSEEHLLFGQQEDSRREQRQDSNGVLKCRGASVLCPDRTATSAASAGTVAASLCPRPGEAHAEIHNLASSLAASSAVAASTFTRAATCGETETAPSGTESAKAAPQGVTTAGNPRDASAVCPYATAEFQGTATTAPTAAATSLLPAVRPAAPGDSLPSTASAAPVAAGALAQAGAVEPNDSSTQNETYAEKERQQRGGQYRASRGSTAPAERDAFYYLLKGVGADQTAGKEGTAAFACNCTAGEHTETDNTTAAVAVLLEAWDWLGVRADRAEGRTAAETASAAGGKAAHDATQGAGRQGEWQHQRGRQPLQEMQRQRQRQEDLRQHTQRLLGDQCKVSKKRFCCIDKTPASGGMEERGGTAAAARREANTSAKTTSARQPATKCEVSYAEEGPRGETLKRMTSVCSYAAADTSLAAGQTTAAGDKTATSGREGLLTSTDTVPVTGERIAEVEQTEATESAKISTFPWHAAQCCCYPHDAADEDLQRLQPSKWEQRRQQLNDEKHEQQQRGITEQYEQQENGEGNQLFRKAVRYSTVDEDDPVDVERAVGQQRKIAVDQHTVVTSLSLSAPVASASVAPIPLQPAVFSVGAPAPTPMAVEYLDAPILSDAAGRPSMHGAPATEERQQRPLRSLSAKPECTVMTAPAHSHEEGRQATTQPAAAGTQSAAEERVVHAGATANEVQTSSIRCERLPGAAAVFEEESRRREGGSPERSTTWSSTTVEQQRSLLQAQPLPPALCVADQQSCGSSYLQAAAATAAPAPDAAANALPLPVAVLTPAPATAPATALPLSIPASASAAAPARALASAATAAGLLPAEAAQAPPSAAASPASTTAAALSTSVAPLPALRPRLPVTAAALPHVTGAVPQEVVEQEVRGQSSALGSATFITSPYYPEVRPSIWISEEQAHLRPKEEMHQERHQQERQSWQQVGQEASQWKQGGRGNEGERQQQVAQQAEKQHLSETRLLSASPNRFSSARDTSTPPGWRPSSPPARFAVQSREEETYVERRDSGPLQQQLALHLPYVPTLGAAVAVEATGLEIPTAEGCCPSAAHTRRSELIPAAPALRSRSAAPCFAPPAPATDPAAPSSFAYTDATGTAAAVPAILAAPADNDEGNRFVALPVGVRDASSCCSADSPVDGASGYEAGQHRNSDSSATAVGASPSEGLLTRVPPPPPPPPPPRHAASLVSHLPHLPAISTNAWRSPRLPSPAEDCRDFPGELRAPDSHVRPSVVTTVADTQTEDFRTSATAFRRVTAESAGSSPRELPAQHEKQPTLQEHRVATQQQQLTLQQHHQNMQQQQEVEVPQLGQVRLQQQERVGDSSASQPAPLSRVRPSGFVSFPPSPSLVPERYKPWQHELRLFSTGEEEQQQSATAVCEKNELSPFYRETREQQQGRERAEKQHLQQPQQQPEQQEENEQAASCDTREEENDKTRGYFPMTPQSRVFAVPPGDLFLQSIHQPEALQVSQHLYMQQSEHHRRADTTTEEAFLDIDHLLPPTVAGVTPASDSTARAASFRSHAEAAETAAAVPRRTTLTVPAVAVEGRSGKRSPQAAAYSYDAWDDSSQQRGKQWNTTSSRNRSSSNNAVAVCVGRVEEGARPRSPIACMAATQTTKSERRGAAPGTKQRKASAIVLRVTAASRGSGQPTGAHHSRTYADENNFSTVVPVSKAAVTKVVFPATTGGATAAAAAGGRVVPERRCGDGGSLRNAVEYENMIRGREDTSGRHSGRGRPATTETATATAVGNFRRTAYTQQQRTTRIRGQRFPGGAGSCSRYVVCQPRHGAAGWREEMTTTAPPPPPPPLQEGGNVGSTATAGKFGAAGAAEAGFLPARAGTRGFPPAAFPTGSPAPANPRARAELPALAPRNAAGQVEMDWKGRRSSSACPSGGKRKQLLQQTGDLAGGGRRLHPYAASAAGCRGGRQLLSQQPQHNQQQHYLSLGFGGSRESWGSEGKRQSSIHETASAISEYSGNRGSRRGGCVTTKEGISATDLSFSCAAATASKGAPTPAVIPPQSLVVTTAASPALAAPPPPAVTAAIAKMRGSKTLAERRKPESQAAAAAAAKQLVVAAARTEKDAATAAAGEIAAAESGPAGRRGVISAAAATAGSLCAAAREEEEEGGVRNEADNPTAAEEGSPAGEGTGRSRVVEAKGDREAAAAAAVRGEGVAGITHVTTAQTGSRRARGVGRATAAETAAQTAAEGAADAVLHATTAAAGSAEAKEGCRGEAEQGKEEKGLTTVMLRNIPNKYSRQQVMEEIDVHFKGTYNFFYLPIDFVHGCNVGYCFINFLDVATAEAFRQEFEGKRLSLFKSRKICSCYQFCVDVTLLIFPHKCACRIAVNMLIKNLRVTYGRVQGLKAILEHYFNSAVVQAQYASWRPVVLKDCVEQPWSELHNVFPELFDSKFPASSSPASVSSTGKRGSSSWPACASEKDHGISSPSSASSSSSFACGAVVESLRLNGSSADEGGDSHAAVARGGRKGTPGVGAPGAAPGGNVVVGNGKFSQGQDTSSCSGVLRTEASARGPRIGEREPPGSENIGVVGVATGTAGAAMHEEYVAPVSADGGTPTPKCGGKQSRAPSEEPAEGGNVESGGEESELDAGTDGAQSLNVADGRTTMTSSLAGAEGAVSNLAAPVADAAARTAERSERPKRIAGERDPTSLVCENLLVPRRLSIGRRRGRKLGVTIEARRRELRNLVGKHECAADRYAPYRDSFAAAAVPATGRCARRGCSPGTRLRFYIKSSSSSRAAGAAATAAGSKKHGLGATGHEIGPFSAPAPADYPRTAVSVLNAARCRGYIHSDRSLALSDTAAVAGVEPSAGTALTVGGGGGGTGVAEAHAAPPSGNGVAPPAVAAASGLRTPPTTAALPPLAGEASVEGEASAEGRVRRQATTAGCRSCLSGTVAASPTGGPRQQQQLYTTGAGWGECVEDEKGRASADAERMTRDGDFPGSNENLRTNQQCSTASVLQDNRDSPPPGDPLRLQLPREKETRT